MKIVSKKRIWAICILSVLSVVFTLCGCISTERWSISKKVEATCTSGGYTEYISNFGKVKTENLTSPLSHDWVLIDEKDALCEAQGSKTYECSHCKEIKIEYENPNGHNYEIVSTIEPTCTESGYTIKSCICGYSYKENFTNALEHSYEDAGEKLSLGATKMYCGVCEKYFLETEIELDVNGEFEGFNFENDDISNWETIGAGEVDIVSDTFTNDNGSRVILMNKPSEGANFSVVSKAFHVNPGKAFTVSYDFYGTGYYCAGTVVINFYDIDMTLLTASSYNASRMGAGVWHKINTETCVVPEDAVVCAVKLMYESYKGGVTDSIYYDNVKIDYLPVQPEEIIVNDTFNNSDFEKVGNAGIIGWTVIGGNAETVKLSQTIFHGTANLGNALQGANSLYIDSTSSVVSVRSSLLQVQGGIPYEISAKSIRYYTYGVASMKVEFYQDATMVDVVASYEISKPGRECDGVLTSLLIKEISPINARYLTVTLSVNEGHAGFFDDVKVVAITEENMLNGINRKIESGAVSELLTLLQQELINTQNINSSKYMMKYYAALNSAQKEKGCDLDKAEIQACIDAVNKNPENFSVQSSLINGSFESIIDGKLEGWTIFGYNSDATKRTETTINTEYTSAGKTSLKVVKEHGGATGVTSDYIPVEVGEAYYVSVDIFAIGFEPSLYLGVKFYADKGEILEDYVRTAKKQSRDKWLSLGMVVTIPENVLYVTVGVSSSSSVTKCTCYFDNVEFRKVTQDDLTDEFNELVKNNDVYQIKLLLQSTEWISGTGFRIDRLHRYMYAFKSAQKKSGYITYDQIKELMNQINADVAAYDKVIINDVISQIKTELVASDLGYLRLPDLMQEICIENYIITKIVAGNENSEYCKVVGDSLLITKRPSCVEQNFSTTVSIMFILGNVNIVEQFELTIEKYQTLEQQTLAELTFEDVKGDNESELAIRSDLELPAELNGITILWASSDTDLIDEEGKVTLAKYGEKQAVTLTAYINEENMKDFNFFVDSKYQDETESIPVNNYSFETAADVSLENYSFENFEAKQVDGWLLSSNFGTFELSKEQKYFGDYSLKVIPEAGLDACFVFTNGIFNVTEEARYRATVMAYTEGAEAWPGMYLEFYNIQGSVIDVAAVEYDYTKLGTWQKLSVEYKAPTSAVFIRVQLYSCADIAYFDGVVVEKLPQVDNGEFSNGENAWEGGNINDGVLTLSAGETAISTPNFVYGKDGICYPATYGMDYIAFANAKGSGKLTLTFYDAYDGEIGVYDKNFDNVDFEDITLKVSAPARSYGYKLSLSANTASAYFDSVVAYNAPYGTQTVDGSFENGESVYWSMNNAFITQSYKTDGEYGVEILENGNIATEKLTVLAGKTYYFTANVENGATSGLKIKIDYYDKWNTPKGSTVIEQPEYEGDYLKQQFIPSIETAYAIATFSAGNNRVFLDDVQLRTVSTSISNAQFESIYDALFYSTGYGGSSPHQWSVYGNISANAITGFNYPDGMVAVRLVGEGEFRSSYTIADAGVEYEGRIFASQTDGTAKLTLSFYDENFNLIYTETNKTKLDAENWKEFAIKALSPVGTRYYTMDISVSGKVLVDHASVYEYVRKVGSITQTFMDDYIIESSTGLESITHQAEISDALISNREEVWAKQGAGMYGTIMYDQEEGKYKLWCQLRTDYTDVGYGIGYAESLDGYNWTFPVLNQCSYAGSTENNLFAGRYRFLSLTVYKDNDEPDANKRYKGTFHFTGEDDDPNDGITRREYYHIAYSPDGINWTIDKKFLDYHDVVIMSHDDENDLFVVVAKCVIERRDMHNMVVKDLEDLDKVIPIKMNSVATPLDGLDCYYADSNDVTVLARNGVYLGWSNVITLEDSGMMNGSARLKLLFSRDLSEDWYRPTYEEMVKSTQKDVTYMGGFKQTSNSWLYTEDKMMFIVSGHTCGQWEPYYVGDVDNYGVSIHYASWRMDGFMSLRATELGTLTTKAMDFDGDTLSINATVNQGGSIRVELLDESGNVINGYSKDDCDVITGDGIKLTVSFNGESDLSALENTNVRLRFYVENADLYSFGFSVNG